MTPARDVHARPKKGDTFKLGPLTVRVSKRARDLTKVWLEYVDGPLSWPKALPVNLPLSSEFVWSGIDRTNSKTQSDRPMDGAP